MEGKVLILLLLSTVLWNSALVVGFIPCHLLTPEDTYAYRKRLLFLYWEREVDGDLPKNTDLGNRLNPLPGWCQPLVPNAKPTEQKPSPPPGSDSNQLCAIDKYEVCGKTIPCCNEGKNIACRKYFGQGNYLMYCLYVDQGYVEDPYDWRFLPDCKRYPKNRNCAHYTGRLKDKYWNGTKVKWSRGTSRSSRSRRGTSQL